MRIWEQSFHQLLFILPRIHVIHIVVTPVAGAVLQMLFGSLIYAPKILGRANAAFAGGKVLTQMIHIGRLQYCAGVSALVPLHAHLEDRQVIPICHLLDKFIIHSSMVSTELRLGSAERSIALERSEIFLNTSPYLLSKARVTQKLGPLWTTLPKHTMAEYNWNIPILGW